MKAIWVVVINNFLPKTLEYTLPNIKNYADKIGADFKLITERKFPDFPESYEKLQIYKLGKKYDWNILIDADMVIHPYLWDITKLIPPTKFGFYASFDVRQWFEMDDYFLRDERFLGVASNFIAIPKMCHDFWTPFEMPYNEIKNKSLRVHGIDDYCFARNIAKFGLKEFPIITKGEIHLIHHFCAGGNNGNDIDDTISKEASDLLYKWGAL